MVFVLKLGTCNLKLSDAHALVADAVLGDGLVRATFAGVRRAADPGVWQRVIVRPVDLKGTRHIQFAYYDARKHVTKTYLPKAAAGPLADVLGRQFAGIHVTTTAEEIDVRTSKKGDAHVGRKAVAGAISPVTVHDRAKAVPFPDGVPNRVLEVMGICTPEGRVRPGMRAKFTQINEFLKQLSHALAETDLEKLGRELLILDCGCGSSYLTLAAHHYLNAVRDIPARLLGVDVNDDLIRKSTEKGHTLNADGLTFVAGRIGQLDVRPDVVFALHACDTATDDALAQAIRATATLVLCVPCCHSHLNKQLRAEPRADENLSRPAAVLQPVFRHAILRERTADILTDTFRSLALRVTGYKTDVVEFVGTEHTPRNLMIRAIRAGRRDTHAVREYEELKRFLGVTPYLEVALGETFAERLSDGTDVALE